VMYVLSTGCQWRAIPKDLPPRSTVHDYLERWTWDGTLERLHHGLYVIPAARSYDRLRPNPVAERTPGASRNRTFLAIRQRRQRAQSGRSADDPEQPFRRLR
jgi:transposase